MVGVIADISHMSGELHEAREQRTRECQSAEACERVPDPDFPEDSQASSAEGGRSWQRHSHQLHNFIFNDSYAGDITTLTGKETVFGEFLARMPHLTLIEGSFPVATSTLEKLQATQPENGDRHVLCYGFIRTLVHSM